MSNNYLIGIGGSGARVIESIIYLCAAGYGPKELSIFLIDPDSGNGNLTRTRTLISNYINCFEDYNSTGEKTLFKTKIKIPSDPSKLVWEIFSDKKVTLSNYINYPSLKQTNPELAAFIGILFTDNELKKELDEGFRGHPSIGAVVMANPPEEEYPFKLLWDDVVDKKPNDVKVFLVGSVFGGTGAAGFPTLGANQILKNNPKAIISENESKILLGGALLLPYFKVIRGDEPQENDMFVTSEDFPIATKAALQYYNDKQLGFDQIYLIGDSLGQKVGKFGVGSKKQENSPHYIEIASSLAAFDFYKQPVETNSNEKKYFTACRESEIVDWANLPFSRNPTELREEISKFKSLITVMTVFAYSFSTYGDRIIKQSHKDSNIYPWYSDHFKFKEKTPDEQIFNPRLANNLNIINRFTTFFKSYLKWILLLDMEDGNVQLIDKSKLTNKPIEINKDLELINPEEYVANIGALLKNETSHNLTFNNFITDGLNQISINDKTISASSKYIDLFYQGSLKFSKLNYNIN